MKQPNDIIKELKEMGSPLADMPRIMPYSVPEGYFSSLDSQIKSLMAALDNEPFFAIDAKEMPYDIPAGYFDTLPEKMLFGALESDQVADLPKSMPFAAPAGYFDNLPQQILQAARDADAPVKPKTRTISLGKSLRWAAAAILLLGIGITSYQTLMPGNPSTEQAISALPSNVLNEYVSQNPVGLETELNYSLSLASNIKGLDQLKEEDIEIYLEETGWDESLIN
jgi:hypothetical protein